MLVLCDTPIPKLDILCSLDGKNPVRSSRFLNAYPYLSKIRYKSDKRVINPYLHYESEDFRYVFDKLSSKLYGFGGNAVHYRGGITKTELNKMLRRGQFWYGKGSKLMVGRPSRCHVNSVKLWDNNRSKSVIVCGFALGVDGRWVHHSWLVNVQTNKNVVIETTARRLAYFGYAMTLKESEEDLRCY